MKLKVLVVDDMPIVSQGTALWLEDLGYEAYQAVSGAAAIELFKTTQYAAIIMDFNMPKMKGFECTAKIRELERQSESHTPIICMSANNGNDDEMKARCLAAGLDDYLNKDCTNKKFSETLSKWTADKLP